MPIKNLYILGLLSLTALMSAGPGDHKKGSDDEESEIIVSGDRQEFEFLAVADDAGDADRELLDEPSGGEGEESENIFFNAALMETVPSEHNEGSGEEQIGSRFSQMHGQEVSLLLESVAECSNGRVKCGIRFPLSGFERYDGRAVAWREIERVMPESFQKFREGIRVRPAQTGGLDPESKLIHISKAGKVTAVHHLTLFMENAEMRKHLLNSIRSHYEKKLTLREVLETFQHRAQEQSCSLSSLKFFFALLTFKDCNYYPFVWNLGFGNQKSVALGCDSLPICSNERYDCASDCFLINPETLEWQKMSRLRRSEPHSTEPQRFYERRTPKEVFVQVAHEKIEPHAAALFPREKLCLIQ